YRDLADTHLTGWETGAADDGVLWLRCRTLTSGVTIALAARTRAAPRGGTTRTALAPRAAHRVLTVPLRPGFPATVDKTVALRTSEVSRALLDYRHRRLPAARRAAREAGRAGAMYPWQSGSDGREETQRLHLNPRSGRWLPDHSHLQHHVGSAIAYNVWRYWQ